MIEKIVTRPIYYGLLPYVIGVGGIWCGFVTLFLVNLAIAIPLIRYQDMSDDVLGIGKLKSACASKEADWARRLGKILARVAVFCILLDQTDPLFSFLVYRRDKERGITFRGAIMLLWHNALITAWWTFIQSILVKYLGEFFYWLFFRWFTYLYS